MEYLRLNHTDLIVSSISLGTGPFDTLVPMDESLRILDKFYEAGGRLLDTAWIYGRGHAELCVGAWLRANKPKDLIILSKVGHKGAVSVEEMREHTQVSLERLGIDKLDIVLFHHDAPDVQPERLIENANVLVDEGLTRYIGCSNWSPVRMSRARAHAAQKGISSFVVDETLFNLAAPNPERVARSNQKSVGAESFAYHKETGMTLFAHSAQANGIFSVYDRPDFFVNEKYRGAREFFYNTCTQERILRAKAMADRKRVSIVHIVLGFLRAQPFQLVPVIGPHTVDELEQSLAAADFRLTDGEVKELVGDAPFGYDAQSGVGCA